MTKLNEQILNMIRESPKHLTAEDAFLLAKSKGISVSLASIYRILNKLSLDGYIRRMTIEGNVLVFDKNLLEHAHLICKRCGNISDYIIPDFMNNLKDLTGINVCSYELSMEYICESCRKKENNESSSNL